MKLDAENIIERYYRMVEESKERDKRIKEMVATRKMLDEEGTYNPFMHSPMPKPPPVVTKNITLQVIARLDRDGTLHKLLSNGWRSTATKAYTRTWDEAEEFPF